MVLQTINGEDELDSVKLQLHEKKKECEQMEKKLNSALSESAVNQKEVWPVGIILLLK